MRRLRARAFWLAVLLSGGLAVDGVTSSRAEHRGQTADERQDVRLLVLVTVDQFRFDYLTRFSEGYNSGIARLMRDGAVFLAAHLEHYPTVTGPGHAALGSGAMPSSSGIIGNDWFDRETGKSVTSVSDDRVKGSKFARRATDWDVRGPTGTRKMETKKASTAGRRTWRSSAFDRSCAVRRSSEGL